MRHTSNPQYATHTRVGTWGIAEYGPLINDEQRDYDYRKPIHDAAECVPE